MRARRIIPAEHQPSLPQERLIVPGPPSAEAIELDVLFVGGGPAGLAGAIELARLARQATESGESPGELSIGVLEKATTLGAHCLSGAVVDPGPLRRLFPDVEEADLPLRAPVEREAVYLLTPRRALRVPTPPTMHNRGCRIASICEIVRWLGERAESLGVDVFAGFPAGALRVEGSRVIGVRTVAAGLDRDGRPTASHVEPADVLAKITVLAEGARGMLSQAWLDWQDVGSANPQIYALGVKELWKTGRPLDRVIHTMGWPLPRDVFGGSFLYPLEAKLVALGLVVGLDHRHGALDAHVLLQRLKTHPLVRPLLEGGEPLEWGAKTIPEGGWWSLPERRYGDGVLIAGDSAGFVDVASLKGIHYAIESGMLAARVALAALRAGDTSAARLAEYDRLVERSAIGRDLRLRRNMRLGFRDGLVRGALKAWLMALTGGRFPGGRIEMLADAAVPREPGEPSPFTPDGEITFSKADSVFRSGNATRDTIPSHLLVADAVDPELAGLYAALCPAGVYERVDGRLTVNAPNCVDCKATDVLGPRWTPREGGSGPAYERM